MVDINAYEKDTHYENARSLLEKRDLQSLRYACLELRYFIEAHVYQQLLVSAEEIPRTVIETWQPNKAIKLLSAFDDLADKDLELSIFDASGELTTVTKYNNISIKELNKIYNSLGSYLHLPMPNKLNDYKIDIKKIVRIFEILERLTTGNLMVVRRKYSFFPCEACGENILYTDNYLESNNSIACQNDSCLTEHAIIKSEGGVSVWSRYDFDCGVCNKKLSVFFSKIKDGYSFDCDSCKTKYKFMLEIRGVPPDE